MSQAQVSFIGKIKNWLKSLFQKKEELIDVVEAVEEMMVVVDKVEEIIEIVSPKNHAKVLDASKTINETIAKVRGTNTVINETLVVAEELLVAAETTVESFKKGRYDETEIATITNAIVLAGKLEVDWQTLSNNLNRDIKSIKAKAKLLSN